MRVVVKNQGQTWRNLLYSVFNRKHVPCALRRNKLGHARRARSALRHGWGSQHFDVGMSSSRYSSDTATNPKLP